MIPEADVTPPPFMENSPFETRLEDMILQQDAVEDTPFAEEPEPVTAQAPVEPSQPQPPPVACRISSRNTVSTCYVTVGFVTEYVSSRYHSLGNP